jgi:hypothetical protein
VLIILDLQWHHRSPSRPVKYHSTELSSSSVKSLSATSYRPLFPSKCALLFVFCASSLRVLPVCTLMSTDYRDSHPLTPYLCFSDSFEDSESESSGRSHQSTPQKQLLDRQPSNPTLAIPRSIPSNIAPEPDTAVLQKVYERLLVGSTQKFSGRNAKAWLCNIQRDLAAAGVMDSSPALFFDIIDMILSGNAATSLRKDTRISDLLEEPASATADDVAYFKDTL